MGEADGIREIAVGTVKLSWECHLGVWEEGKGQ